MRCVEAVKRALARSGRLTDALVEDRCRLLKKVSARTEAARKRSAAVMATAERCASDLDDLLRHVENGKQLAPVTVRA